MPPGTETGHHKSTAVGRTIAQRAIRQREQETKKNKTASSVIDSYSTSLNVYSIMADTAL